MQAIIVIATWGSGSTAVSGYLDRCGAYTCPPHVNTNDLLTPNAYEPLEYRIELAKLIDELSFKKIGNPEDFVKFFEAWWEIECAKSQNLGLSHILLKHPLQSFVLPYLNRKLKPSYLFITRPYDLIEKTRIRRKWHPIYGALGAKEIYSISYDFLNANSCPFISIPFNEFRSSTELRDRMLNFIGLVPSAEKLKVAEDFIRV